MWLFGNIWPLNAITIDRLDYVLPESLCLLFDIPLAWVLNFCEAALLAIEQARGLAVQQHLDRIQLCLECDGHMLYLTNEFMYTGQFVVMCMCDEGNVPVIATMTA
ncbi:hypothetical protein L210DRAFT_3514049 [Boletus edulis BED1]|uniref:Uncharacterized protein n=1 Tax=Boletus edulis BED1 TaxID=1328754 RepID=A0AAD4G4W2_BOLED|nr:hypothetical protein L210DRAFT_3514049 [Boletus edulis BED1]